jgi:hypothetical protein
LLRNKRLFLCLNPLSSLRDTDDSAIRPITIIHVLSAESSVPPKVCASLALRLPAEQPSGDRVIAKLVQPPMDQQPDASLARVHDPGNLGV